jgi:glycosyltransferase involved in cell wall biosynthesis
VNWDRRLQGRLIAAVEAQMFDVVHVEHLRGARYGLPLTERVPVLWDSVDSISHLFEQARYGARSFSGRLMAALELPRTRPYEAWLARRFHGVIVTSEVDRRALLARRDGPQVLSVPERDRGGAPADPPPIEVIPNIVDFEFWRPGPEARPGDTIVMTGKMSYHANVTAALHLIEDVMPRVWERRPEAKLLVAGARPARAIRAAAAGAAGVVEVTGYVDDLRTVFARATVAAAPVIYGAGMQNKVLEALATRTPVVVSPLAAEPLGLEDGVHVLVADDAAAFAAALLRLLEEPALARRIASQGRALVEARHAADRVAPELEEAYAGAIARRPREA